MAAAADAMKEVVATVVPLVKRAGFKKRRHTFNRTPERGLVHVINFQMGPFTPPGPGSEAHATGSEALGIIDSDLYGTFTINLGVYAAAMVIDESVQPGTWVNHYNCQLRRRIGQLLTNEDVWWSLDAPDEVGGVVETALTVAALPWLDQFMTTSSIVDAFLRDGGDVLGMTPRAPVEIAFLLKDDQRAEAEALIRSYLAEDLRSGHRAWLEPHLESAGFGHLL